jgi:hypothetical protein
MHSKVEDGESLEILATGTRPTRVTGDAYKFNTAQKERMLDIGVLVLVSFA